MAEWLAWRRRGIGGSDAAAILGLNKYKSAFDVYAEKIGLVTEIPDNEAMRQGRDLEDYVAKRFEEATGKRTRRRNAILQHPEHTFMIGNIDRWVVGENAGLECKTTTSLNPVKFAQGEYPADYYVQCMHYMALTGAEHWHLAVLVLGKSFHTFVIERDEAEIEALVNAEKNFWEEHVVKRIPPTPDGSDSTGEFIKAMFSEADAGKEPVSLIGYEEKARQYLELQDKAKQLEKEQEQIKQELQLLLGAAEKGIAQGYVVEWRGQERQTLDTTRLKSEMPEIYQKYAKNAQIRTFKIKEI
jgi:putative phage-type endonuclease